MSYGVYDNTHAMMDFTELLKTDPKKAYDFISCNAYRFTKEGLTDILKEVLYSIHYHTNGSFYGSLYENILGDVQVELDENYDEEYQEYAKWIDDVNKTVAENRKNEMIKKVAESISNPSYNNNLQATKELMELFDYIKETRPGQWMTRKPLETWEDYVQMYDDNYYTYQTWGELVRSEEEQSDGLTEDECKAEINSTIWRLPCGWYVQYV